MSRIRKLLMRSSCAGMATLTSSLNLLPVLAAVQEHQSVSTRAQSATHLPVAQPQPQPSPVNPIPVASTPVHPKAKAEPAKTKAVEPPVSEATDTTRFTEVESAPLSIRVRVGESAQTAIQFATSTDAVLTAGGQAFQLEANTPYAAVASPQGIQVGDLTVTSFEVDPGEAGYVFIGDRWYYGKLHLVRTTDGLISVNELPLEAYLYSVVGAEMPTSWSVEALKAQAVAARSYAVAHLERPASDWFDLGDDERWQAYKGSDSMDQNSIAAVQATLGQVLSQNGRIHEAQYASTETISIAAHGGRGMSQHGAQEMAQAGNNYLQILGRYYPNTALALMQ